MIPNIAMMLFVDVKYLIVSYCIFLYTTGYVGIYTDYLEFFLNLKSVETIFNHKNLTEHK